MANDFCHIELNTESVAFAIVADPTGAVFGIWEPAAKA